MAAPVTRDSLRLAGLVDVDPVYRPLDQNGLMRVLRRYRVIIRPVAHQRLGRNPAALFVAGVIGCCRQRHQLGPVTVEPDGDGVGVAAQYRFLSLDAAVQQSGIQGIEISRHRQGHHEVAATVANQPFHLAFVVALGRASKFPRKSLPKRYANNSTAKSMKFKLFILNGIRIVRMAMTANQLQVEHIKNFRSKGTNK